MLGIGVALFVAPIDGATLWPWALTPLTARAVGSFLCGFAVAAAFAARENDLDRLRGPAYSYAALGALELLAVALHSGDLSGTTLECSVYVGFCATVAAMGLYGVLGLGLQRSQRPRLIPIRVDAHAAAVAHRPDVPVSGVDLGATATPDRAHVEQHGDLISLHLDFFDLLVKGAPSLEELLQESLDLTPAPHHVGARELCALAPDCVGIERRQRRLDVPLVERLIRVA